MSEQIDGKPCQVEGIKKGLKSVPRSRTHVTLPYPVYLPTISAAVQACRGSARRFGSVGGVPAGGTTQAGGAAAPVIAPRFLFEKILSSSWGTQIQPAPLATTRRTIPWRLRHRPGTNTPIMRFEGTRDHRRIPWRTVARLDKLGADMACR